MEVLAVIFGIICLVIIAGSFVFVVAVTVFKTSLQRIKKVWSSIALKLELQYIPGDSKSPGKIQGKLKNHLITVDSVSKSLGHRSIKYTRFQCTYSKPVNIQFKLLKQFLPNQKSILSRIGDITVGDSDFDENVIIKMGKSEERSTLNEFLNAPRRNCVKSAVSSFNDITITNEFTEAHSSGLLEDSLYIRNRIKRLIELADIFSKERKQDHPIEQAIKARVDGEIQKAVDILQETEFDDKDEMIEAKELEGQLFFLADEKEKAEEAFHQLVEEIPDDKRARKWEQMLKEDEETPSHASIGEILLKEFISKIFGEGIGSFDSARIFDKEYRDSEISWEGTLISATEFSFDFVFKNTTGVKATFELMELKTGYLSNRIKAVVHFPKDQVEILKGSLNQKMKFTGKLVSVDALVKNIFVAEGKLF